MRGAEKQYDALKRRGGVYMPPRAMLTDEAGAASAISLARWRASGLSILSTLLRNLRLDRACASDRPVSACKPGV